MITGGHEGAKGQESENVLSSIPPLSAKSSSLGLPCIFATANLGKLCRLLYKQTILHPSHKESSHNMYLLTNGWISRETVFCT